MRGYVGAGLLGVLVVALMASYGGGLDKGGFAIFITSFSLGLGAVVALVASAVVLVVQKSRPASDDDRPAPPPTGDGWR